MQTQAMTTKYIQRTETETFTSGSKTREAQRHILSVLWQLF